jgi:uncharacterized protein
LILLDANLILYAFRKEYPQHSIAHSWLEEQLAASETLILHPLAVAAFLRLSTKQLGLLRPAPVPEVLKFIAVLENSAVRLPEHSSHGKVLARLCERHEIRGDGLVEASLAAFAITNGLILASHDRAFSRFIPELDWIDPISSHEQNISF